MDVDRRGAGGGRTNGARVGRVGRVYDWWSDHRWLFRALQFLALSGRYGRLHGLAVDRLFVGEGDDVLDLGSGPGVNFPALAGAVGDEGRVVGLDASRGMARRARQRAATVDGRPFPTLPLAYLNPVVNPVSAWATEWHPDRDVRGSSASGSTRSTSSRSTAGRRSSRPPNWRGSRGRSSPADSAGPASTVGTAVRASRLE